VSRVLSRVWVSLALGLALALGVTVVQAGSAKAAPRLDGESATPTQGTPVPGSYLTADLGAWQAPGPVTYEFQWLRDGAPIAGATSRDYLAQAADVGHQVAPQVTGRREGYDPDTFTGTAVAVRKIGSLVTLEVKRLHPPGKNRLAWTGVAMLSTERPWTTDGGIVSLVKVEDDHARTLASGPVVRGAAFVQLSWKRAPRGRTKLIACFAGSDVVEASCSEVDVVRRPQRGSQRH
jgi:hypothetical protein